jgi:hypothetical protein
VTLLTPDFMHREPFPEESYTLAFLRCPGQKQTPLTFLQPSHAVFVKSGVLCVIHLNLTVSAVTSLW